MVAAACPLKHAGLVADPPQFGQQRGRFAAGGGPALADAKVIVRAAVLADVLVAGAKVAVVIGRVGREESEHVVRVALPNANHNGVGSHGCLLRLLTSIL